MNHKGTSAITVLLLLLAIPLLLALFVGLPMGLTEFRPLFLLVFLGVIGLILISAVG